MLTAKYWARGSIVINTPARGELSVSCRGWSNDSLDDAEVQARKRAELVARRVAKNEASGQRYLYGDRPLPEPVLEEISSPFGVIALLTTNSYGSDILNTKDLVFVDADGTEPRPSLWETLARLVGVKAGSEFGSIGSVAEKYVEENRGAGIRLYKTHSGHRLLLTNKRLDPVSSGSTLDRLQSDPLYVRLCAAQKSFRARLTPKPWRCGVPVPPVTFPFQGTTAEKRFKDWQEEYRAAAEDFATCRLLTVFGEEERDGLYRDLIERHDRITKATASLPLA